MLHKPIQSFGLEGKNLKTWFVFASKEVRDLKEYACHAHEWDGKFLGVITLKPKKIPSSTFN